MSRVREAVERVLALSRADDCIAIGSEQATANIRWANNTATTNGVSESGHLVVIAIRGRRVGTVSVTYFPPERLESIVREAEAACEGKPEAEDYMPLLPAEGVPADWEAPAAGTGVEVFESFAAALAGTMRRAEREEVKLFGYAEHGAQTLYLGTSSGLRRRWDEALGTVELNAKSPDFARSVWTAQATRAFEDVDLEAHYHRLRRRLEWSERRVDLQAGHYQVLLEPSAVADLLLYAYWSSSAREADEGHSVYSKPGGGNRIGERIAPEAVTLYSDPREPGFETAPFSVVGASSSHASVFDNGLAIERTEWVAGGVLRNLIRPRWWAEKTGQRPVPFCGNLLFAADAGPSVEEMIPSTERALLVTSLWYIRVVDPKRLLLTGLTRDGVFLVEDGKVRGAANNFRWNMSPVEMLGRVAEVGRSVPTVGREFGDFFRRTRMPPLRVDDWNMSSVSPAT